VLTGATDADGDTLSPVLILGPSHGSLSLAADGSFSYTPAHNYNGTDAFTFQASDGTLVSGIQTISLTIGAVNDPPTAVADAYSTAEDTPLTAGSVLANDTDAENDPLTAMLATMPAHGAIVFNTDGTFTYTPAANYHGVDTFTYVAKDASSSSTPATVFITVSSVDDAPVAVDDARGTTKNTTLNGVSVLGNDTDVDGDPLSASLVGTTASGALMLNSDGTFTYTPNNGFVGTDTFTYEASDGTKVSNVATVTITVTNTNTAPVAVDDGSSTNEDTMLSPGAGVLANDTDVDGDPLTATLVTGPLHGALVFAANGTFTYTPNANYNGPDSFTYKANDGAVDGNTATVSITVISIDDAPVAIDDAYPVAENGTLNIVAVQGVLANDTDVEGDPLAAVLISDVAHGALTLNPDGSFTYVPALDYYGPDSFTYKANDGSLDSGTATVNLTVNHVNQAPVAVDDNYDATMDTTLVVSGPGVLGNDTDADGDPLTAVLVAGPSNGMVTLNPDGSFTYTPNSGYTGPDSFTYLASDGAAISNTATVALNVTP
jgi:VCBS repeat-containing protein